MMTMNALITSRDPNGRQATSLFEAAYNKAKLDDLRAQLLNEKGGELQAGIIKLINELTMSNQYASEETKSNYTYPSEYKGPKPIQQQIVAIADIFKLDPVHALEFAKNLPELRSFVPKDALEWTGWFAIPSIDALATRFFPEVTDPAEKYCRAIMLIHEKLAATRSFYNCREGQIDKEHLQMHVRTVAAIETIQEAQKGDIMVIAAQLGMRHRGRSGRRAREVFSANEFGLSSLMVGSIALAHPERFVRSEELDIDCAGDEWSSGGDGQFGRAPLFFFSDGLGFDAVDLDYFRDLFGSGSAFLSQ
ncbi:hypothetical protein A2532_00480 [Candidatus Wolfebacteria bacterium RIFOXYD2_FULL_48_11]|uniref:Uncharacterized protein n=1 Tax=Candidatus Wolfebacteria bacterium RIFOXYD1_FULL_48_65 TaxID=1802561 RepID=A0A1F8E430_9BACT|nr:MAG: hypothetical protein A2610_02045 [Candidatus Wolfebacteria bacterium RIFOXYD1_FULL_48_65]OGM96048.1 MAG: hypothetical protein A2532_00480 [Candidatus Wolfebacteria bacterium RIFOXYD2_FULL_48_11]